jgi:hypothetical protein
MGHSVGAELVGDQHPRDIAQLPEQLAKEPLGSLGIAPGLHQDVQHVSLLIHRPPEVLVLAVDADDHLVEIPLVAGLRFPTPQPVGVG